MVRYRKPPPIIAAPAVPIPPKKWWGRVPPWIYPVGCFAGACVTASNNIWPAHLQWLALLIGSILIVVMLVGLAAHFTAEASKAGKAVWRVGALSIAGTTVLSCLIAWVVWRLFPASLTAAAAAQPPVALVAQPEGINIHGLNIVGGPNSRTGLVIDTSPKQRVNIDDANISDVPDAVRLGSNKSDTPPASKYTQNNASGAVGYQGDNMQVYINRPASVEQVKTKPTVKDGEGSYRLTTVIKVIAQSVPINWRVVASGDGVTGMEINREPGADGVAMSTKTNLRKWGLGNKFVEQFDGPTGYWAIEVSTTKPDVKPDIFIELNVD